MMEDCEDDTEGLTSQDWDIVAEKRKKDGYREGVLVGREAKVQEGFNKGFEDGLDKSLPIGFMCGVLSGIQALSQSLGIPHLSDSNMHDIEDILKRLQNVKSTKVDKSRLMLKSNVSAASSVALEGLQKGGNDSTIGGKVTGMLDTHSDVPREDTSAQGEEDFCQSQRGEKSESYEDESLSQQILRDYKRLLKDLNVEELIDSLTSVNSSSI
ncbi:Yae1 domain-containing protein 1 [Holothuria leucospilota]|uniref:Yae1 domain-containing protein 1 n=1 Tax=Holothuria leucospilota TaxID=206669 RepID=A0A9Q1BHG1_HOLLE|nr:Yae1 domain-containing protein 1 [Holothuria leucospilota]